MYPYYVNGVPQSLGTTGNPSCYDSSPQFAETTTPAFCNKYAFTYPQMATDPDLDRLVYRWSSGYHSPNAPIAYNTGFSYNSPFPSSGVPADTNNVAATLDSLTGDINMQPFDTGYYFFAIRIESYRDNQLISYVMKELPMYIINCPPLPPPSPNVHNEPPAMSITYNGSTQTGSLHDTVYANDRIEFKVSSSDAGILPGFVSQTMTTVPISEEFGTGFADSTAGCLRSPCAVIDTNTANYVSSSQTWSKTGTNDLSFTWQTDCNHLSNTLLTPFGPATYQFVFQTSDNYCPVPGENRLTATFTVLPDTSSQGVITLDSITATVDSITLYWPQYTGSGFTGYHIFLFNPLNLQYEPVDTLPNITTTKYTFEKTASPHRFYVLANTDKCVIPKVYSDVLLTMQQQSGSLYAKLEWNSPVLSTPPAQVKYKIYRSDNSTTFTLIDSLENITTYIDSNMLCSDTLHYRIKAYVNGKLLAVSNTSLLRYHYFNNSVSFVQALSDTAGNVAISWTALDPPAVGFNGYVIYYATDSVGPFTLLDTVKNRAISFYYHANAGADTTAIYYYIRIASFAPCVQSDTLSKRSETISTIDLNLTNLQNGLIQLDWSPFFLKTNKSAKGQYSIYRKAAGSGWVLIDSTAYGNEQYIDSVVVCYAPIQYRVQIDTSGKKLSVEDHITINGYNTKLTYGTDGLLRTNVQGKYTWYKDGDVIPSAPFPIYQPKVNGNYSLIIEHENGCIVTSDTLFIDLTIGIEENQVVKDIKIYPNPNNGRFEVAYTLTTNQLVTTELFDYTGKRVRHESIEQPAGPQITIIKLADQPKGLYLLQLTVGDTVYHKKVIYH
jgi:hypothetical protein